MNEIVSVQTAHVTESTKSTIVSTGELKYIGVRSFLNILY